MKNSKHQELEDLIVWKESFSLCTKACKAINNSDSYALKNQIIRSAISIPSNIAEGYERQSDKEFIKFLYYAKGSSGELRTQLLLAKQLKIISEICSLEIITQSRRVSAMIQNLISAIRKSPSNLPEKTKPT